MTVYRVISADSHFVEPPTIWAERMDARFRDRAPRSQDMIAEAFAGIPDEDVRKIVAGNVARLYGVN